MWRYHIGMCLLATLLASHRAAPTTRLGPATGGCSVVGDDWVQCRQRLVEAAFGELPTRSAPDYGPTPISPRIEPTRLQASSGETRRAPALGNNGGEVGGITRNTSALTWTISDGPLTLNATVYWTLNSTGSAVAPYPTVVCSTTGTFLPPCKPQPPSPSSSLCLNVGILDNHTEMKPFSLLQLYPCQASGLTSNEAFQLDNHSGVISSGWPDGGCLDSLPLRTPLVCVEPPCAVVSDKCDSANPKPSQTWSRVPTSRSTGTFRGVHRPDQLCLTADSVATHALIRLATCAANASDALQEWRALRDGHIQLATAAGSPPKPVASPTCCDGRYVAPASFGHFRGQDHVAFPPQDGVPQGPYSLPMTGADTGPLDLPRQRTKTLILYHNGHGQLWVPNVTEPGRDAVDPLCVRAPEAGEPRLTARWHAECWYNWDTTPGWLSELGYDVMEFNMPLLGPNNNGSIGTRSHEWFEGWEKQGVRVMRFFVEPVSLAINFALTQGYERFVMVGLSGGGWSTTVASALDNRIGLSFPVAGSLPFAMRTNSPWHDGGDFEQQRARAIYDACDYECMYTLASLEEGRMQVQLLHEADSCCFRSGPRHPAIIAYNQEVAERLTAAAAKNGSGGSGTMCTVATAGNVHEVNMRDKAVIGYLIDRYDQGGGPALPRVTECPHLPFNVLHRW